VARLAAGERLLLPNRDGLRHRDDGPAAVYPDGRALWFHDGVRVAPPE
jgi:hypothetical protein